MTIKELSEHYGVNEQFLRSLDRYKNGIPTGGFLRAVLENDLFEAMARADVRSQRELHNICKYVYNEFPTGIYGSKEKVKNHLNQ